MTAPNRFAGAIAALAALLLTALLLAPGAQAANPAPGWSVEAVAAPTNFAAGDSKDWEEKLIVEATGGTYELKIFHGEEEEFLTAPIAWNASAAELQTAIETIPTGSEEPVSGKVKVTAGAATATEHVYTVAWVGAWSGTRPESGVGEGCCGAARTYTEANLVNGAGAGEVQKEILQEGEDNDTYWITATNIGSAASQGPITITDKLPPQLTAILPLTQPAQRQFLEISEREGLHKVEAGNHISNDGECTPLSASTVSCEYNHPTQPVRPGARLELTLRVAGVSPALSGLLANEVTVEGGGAATVQASQSTPVNAGPAPFGVDRFGFEPAGPAGEPDFQAGDHPYSQTTTIDLNTVFAPQPPGGSPLTYAVPQELKDAATYLPLGFVGDPLAAERCPEVVMTHETGPAESGITACPPGSIVGAVRVAATFGPEWRGPFPLYNVVPERGYPAELGFHFAGFGQPTFLYASVVPGASGYRLRIATPGVLRAQEIYVNRVAVTVFGDPSARNGTSGHAAFLTNPTACSSEPLRAGLALSSWEGGSASAEETAYPEVTGCDRFSGGAAFGPRIGLEPQPQQGQADTPAGYQVDLRVPQAPNVFGQIATPNLRDATVKLPAGVAIDPASAGGLAACQATGPEGINIEGPEATEMGEGHSGGNSSPYDDGLIHAAPGHCPAASTLGTVEVDTPLLEKPAPGHIYLGTPLCSPCSGTDAEEGKLVRLYIEVNDPATGVILKLAGYAQVNQTTGQVQGVFKENPQLPFEELRVKFKSGPRAALANPQTCGTYTTTSDLKPWSAPASGPDATPQGSFTLSEGPNGAPCARSEAEEPNSPSFEAGTLNTVAGSFSPFVLKLRREDGSQRLGAINATLPPGLSGRLAGVPYCSEAQIAAAEHNAGNAEKASPSCPAASEVGTVNVGAGAGTNPFYTQGKVYLAGPYKGAPLSLAVITPAVAGPFDLGTVVVRTALYVNPETAQITAKSGPLPTILAGIPLDIRSIAMKIDRPEFTLNPTSCEAMAVSGEAVSTLGQAASLRNRFQAGGCRGLGFKPKLALRLFGKTTRGYHPRLRAVLTMPTANEANIARAAVTLPGTELLENAHIKNVCTRVQYAEGNGGGEHCPARSIYGRAKAWSPLLERPLSGPVYLRSSSHELPDLVASLSGQVHIDLDGRIDSVNGHIRDTFETVPDTPVSRFVLEMQGNRKGLLVNDTNLCKAHPRVTAKFTAHNGLVHDIRPLAGLSCGRKGRSGKHRR